MKIRFDLPRKTRRFASWDQHADVEAARRLFEEGYQCLLDHQNASVPARQDTVYLPGQHFAFSVHDVVHYYGGDEDDPEPFVFVVLR